MNEAKWKFEVGTVFDSRPRNAADPNNKVWISRKKLEDDVLDAILRPGNSLCLDGPSGTGKSSLALTGLSRARNRYVIVQIAKKMDWIAFCMKLIEDPKPEMITTRSATLEGGIEAGLPLGKFQVALESSKSLKQPDQIVKYWSEAEVCNALVEEGVSLFIDDFERASPELVTRIADITKMLTESYKHPKSKLIIVGTEDIYQRILIDNYSLESRMKEISVGTLPDPNFSWQLLLQGFNALKLRHPANSKFDEQRKQVENCIKAIYRYADGLPKSLTDLGYEIAKNSFGKTGVSADDIISTSSQMLERRVQEYRFEFTNLMDLISKSKPTRAILIYLMERGVGNVHTWNETLSFLTSTKEYSQKEIENGIRRLVDKGLITQTGISNNTLYFKNLTLAHTLGVVVSDPQKYGLNPVDVAPFKQLKLPFID